MKYTISLDKSDIVDIIANKFDVKTNQVNFENNDKIEINFEKDVNSPQKKIGFMLD